MGKIQRDPDYPDIAPSTGLLEDSVRNLTFQKTDALARFSVTKVFRHLKYGELPADLKEHIREKNRLKNSAYRTGNPATKRLANRASEQIKRELVDLYNRCWQSKLVTLQTQGGSLFKMIRSLTKGSKRTLPHIVNGGVTLVDPQDTANGFADKLYEHFSLNPSVDHVKEQRIDRKVHLFKSVQFIDLRIPAIDLDEVKGIVADLLVRKAPGLDGLPNAALKRVPERTL